MNTSFLYHAFGLSNLEYHSTAYEDKSIILNVQTSANKLRCSCCGSKDVTRNGFATRLIRCVPIGHKRVFLRMKVQRLKCKDCNIDRQEKIHFTTGNASYTHRLARLVVCLLSFATIKDVANFLHLSWDTVKDIHKRYLHQHFAYPDIRKVRNIGIDEFASKKGHIYKTIVVDLDTGHIIYVGNGKGADSLDKFWKKVKKYKVQIKNVATDLSAAFIASVSEHAPQATHVFDHFHVVKLMNEAIDDIRRAAYTQERDLNKRKVLKGTRWLLLCNGADIYDQKFKSRLDNALEMNKPLAQAYYLKESLKEIWQQITKEQAEIILDDWVKQAKDSKLPRLIKMSNTIAAHRSGILAWYDCKISTAKVEGINNKIKVMKRKAYGFRDDKYFELRLLALHENITANFG